MSAVTDLPTNCNLYGVDPDTTVLEVGETAHGYIKIVESTYSNQTTTVISNLQFHANTAKALELDLLGGASQHTVYLDNCTFSGQAGYVFGVVDKLVMTDCTLEMGTDYAVGIAGYLVVRDCNFTREDDTVRRLAIRSNLYDPEVFSLRLIDTTIVGNGASGYPVVHFDEAEELYCTGTKIFGNYNTTITRDGGYFSGNLFTFLASRYLTIDGAENLLIGNRITGSVTNILRLSSSSTENIVTSNVARGGILDSGTDNQVGLNIS